MIPFTVQLFRTTHGAPWASGIEAPDCSKSPSRLRPGARRCGMPGTSISLFGLTRRWSSNLERALMARVKGFSVPSNLKSSI
jgi:hypothetical protein